MKFNSFRGKRFSEFTSDRSSEIRLKIEQKGKEYILNVDEDEFKNYMIEKYKLIPLEVERNSEEVHEPEIDYGYSDYSSRSRSQRREIYIIKISYSFTGTPFLFNLQPSSCTMTSREVDIDEKSNKVSYSIQMYEKDPVKFEQYKSQAYNDAFVNILNINNEVENWNDQISGIVNNAFNSIKDKYIQENDFFKAINVKVNPETETIFNVPPIKRKIVPQIPKIRKKGYVHEPILDVKIYEDILKVLYETGKNLEKKPSMYIGKNEEALKDFFLVFLETRYDGITATGETFNRAGKTDILLKDSKDSSNIFVAECKIWHGISEYYKAIDQLFENYLTWRDSKVAIILFAKKQRVLKSFNYNKTRNNKTQIIFSRSW